MNVIKIFIPVALLVLMVIVALMWGLPRYNVWQQEMAGKCNAFKRDRQAPSQSRQ